ncbi:MAG: ABC transporter ATP-binding protein [Candidatus Nanoarchaeia archaeon]
MKKESKRGKSIIELRDVWKIYKMDSVEVPALRGVDMDIRRGEFLVVLGPSGSGKSTLLNAIGCLDTPTRGTILLDGQDISKLDESHLAQIRGRKIGYVFQTFNLIPSLSALENVALPMTFQRVPREQRIKKAKELLEKVGLGHRVNFKPAQLSGGERQRVAIARALINDPEVILADEPTGNLDSKTGVEIMSIMEKLNKEGKTIIMITHEAYLTKYAHRVCFLKDGLCQGIKADGALLKEAYK